MKLVLGLILFSMLVMGVISIPSADAASNGRLTIKSSTKSVDLGQPITFTGKLTDRNNEAISGSNIILWEKDRTSNKQLGSGYTSARGEYTITVTAQYWDGIGNPVEIFAYSSIGSLKSTQLTINIDKPRTSTSNGQVNNYVQPVPTNQNVKMSLFLDVREGTQNGSHQIKPVLRGIGGGSLTSNVKIYVDNQYITSLTPHKWSGNLFLSSETFSLTGKFDGAQVGSKTYLPVSETITVKITNSISSNQNTPITKTNNDELSKTATSTKFTYSEILKNIESGVKASEYALSDLKLEHSEAKKKIDSGWDLRWNVWQYHGEAKKKIDNAQSHMNNRQYDYSYNKLVDSESEIYNAKNHLYAILEELKDARDLEKKYQESQRSCVLFWCSDIKNTYGELSSKIQNLQSKLDSLESKTKKLETSKNSFIQSLHKNEINLKNQEIKKLQNIRQQEQVEAERQERLLQEQIKQEQRDAEQERQRLEEQKQRELREQERLAEEERQRLEEKKRIDLARQEIKALGNDFPLLKGIANGDRLNFWVEPMPAYVSNNVRTSVNNLISHFDGNWFNGVKLIHTTNRNNADFTINWVTDYNPNHIGRQVGDHLLVGLGSSKCNNDWKPFDGVTVYRIMYHEVGHAMGQDHSTDFNNIMYSSTGSKYEYDYDETITLSDGYWTQIYFCNTGKIYFSTEKAYDSSASYKVFVLGNNNTPQNVINGVGAFYPDCSGYKTNWNSFSSPCTVQKGSSLVLYNPSSLGTGADARIKIKFEDRNDHKYVNYNFESDSRYFTQSYLDTIRDLFRNNS